MAWSIFKSKEQKLAQEREMAINELVNKLDAINSSFDWRGFATTMASGGYDKADQMHNIYQDFGYPEKLEFTHFWNMYRRFGVAKTVIESPPKIAWLSPPKIESSNAQFVKEFELLVKKQKFWQRLKGLDIRQRVGRYAGLYIRAKDGQSPDKPLKKLNGIESIVELKPMYESQLKAIEFVTDEKDPNYGQPSMYEFDPQVSGNRNKNDFKSIKIHPSRVIIAAEGADDGSIYGIPALECVYNDLMDLRKISGAGGEGFYQNTRNAPFLEAANGFQMPNDPNTLEKLETAVDEWLSKYRKRLMLQGVKPHYPNIQLSTPKEFAQNSINNISAGTEIPSAILVGQQTGRLASEKDADYFLTMIQSRRENFLTDMIEDILDTLIESNVLPSADYEIVWDDILASSDTDKLALGKMMAEMNKWSYDAGGKPIFSEAQIQEKTGYTAQELERYEPPVVDFRDRSGDKLTKPDTGTNIDDA